MNQSLLLRVVVMCGALIFLAVGVPRAAAQGPAGAGASEVAQDSSHSLNPMHWIKKDSKSSTDSDAHRSDVETKLTPILQGEGALPANILAHDACATFVDVEQCLAVLHASHDLGLNFTCMQASVTGVHASADVSGCSDADADKPQGLKEAIHRLKPDANAKQAAKDAEQEAKSDLAKIGEQ